MKDMTGKEKSMWLDDMYKRGVREIWVCLLDGGLYTDAGTIACKCSRNVKPTKCLIVRYSDCFKDYWGKRYTRTIMRKILKSGRISKKNIPWDNQIEMYLEEQNCIDAYIRQVDECKDWIDRSMERLIKYSEDRKQEFENMKVRKK